MRTGHRPKTPQNTLGRLIPASIDKEVIKKDGWNNHRILVVQADDARLSWIERQIVEQLGRKLFGGRHAGG